MMISWIEWKSYLMSLNSAAIVMNDTILYVDKVQYSTVQYSDSDSVSVGMPCHSDSFNCQKLGVLYMSTRREFCTSKR